MDELLLTIVFDLDESLYPAEDHADTLHEDFIEFLKDDPGFTEMDVKTEPGYHAFPDGDEIVVISGKLTAWNGVDYINDEGNREGLEMDLHQAATAPRPAAFLDRCDVQVSLMVEPEVSEAEIEVVLTEAEAHV